MRWLQPAPGVCLVLVALAAAAAVAPSHAGATTTRRALLQEPALSNSNDCLDTIPKCEPGNRCQANYQPVIDASGQDNIVQCVCAPGFFEANSTAASCTRCPANAFCPGGDTASDAPTTRGDATPCGSSLVTRGDGARGRSACVAAAGFALTSPTAATACGASTYSPAFNRLSRCLRCQAGLAEDPAAALTDGQRVSRRAVCKVPPGRFMSQGLVRICPQGFFREGFADFDDRRAQACTPCNAGITTDGAGAGSAHLCNRVVPGSGVSVLNVTSAAAVPALPTTSPATGGLPAAALCELGFHSLNGYCVPCPGGSVTATRGAKAVEECAVPPGYWLPASGLMAACGNGTYREGWALFSDAKAASCNLCGDGIASEARDLDAHPLAPAGSLVRATPASCFIESGFGLLAQGRDVFVGLECPVDTYGASGQVYGLVAAPCKPCPRNMITDGARRANSSDVCINDDGWGYASEGASRCAPGFFSAKGSRRPCLQCPAGRTTLDSAAAQRSVADCLVLPGFGIVGSDSSSNTSCTEAFNPDTTSLSAAALAAFSVLECPAGMFSAGMSAGAKCMACPNGSTTQAPGATSATACNVCLSGYGKNGTELTCSLCAYGTHQPGGQTQCQPCPSASFAAPVDAAGPAWVSSSTTLFMGAAGAESCVPQQSQLAPEAGQAFFAPGSPTQPLLRLSPQPTDLAGCLAACPANSCCWAQYNATNGSCAAAVLEPADAHTSVSGLLLLHRLPAAAMAAASSAAARPRASAQTLASGAYAACAIPAAAAGAWQAGAGTSLGADARTFATASVWDAATTRARCQAKCDESNVCFGVIWDATNQACLYRGGVDALATRSFFVLPTAVDLGSLHWAGRAAETPASCSSGAAGGSTTGNSTVAAGNSTAPAGNSTAATGNTTTPGSVITTVAGAYQNMTPNVIVSYSPLRFHPVLSGESGPATSALLGSPHDVVFDTATSSLYILDQFVGVIRKVDAQGGITTIAGNNTAKRFAGDGGPATSAFFNVPSGMALFNGSLFVADWSNGVIRRIDLTTNMISTVAGNATVGRGYAGDSGPALRALLNPSTVAFDPRNGDMLIAEYDTPRIRRVDAQTGIITTFAGNGTAALGVSRNWAAGMGGPATATAIGAPRGLTVNAQGDVFFACDVGSGLYRVDGATGTITSLVRLTATGYAGDGGPASNATAWNPTDIKLDAAGNLLVADAYNRVVRRISAVTGIITTVVGTGLKASGLPSGDGGHPRQGQVGGTAVGGVMRLFQAGSDLFIADSANFAVRRVSNYHLL